MIIALFIFLAPLLLIGGCVFAGVVLAAFMTIVDWFSLIIGTRKSDRV